MLAEVSRPAEGAIGGRMLLRAATRDDHDALESSPVMATLQGTAPTREAVAAAVAAQYRVYAATEAALRAARPMALMLHPGYRFRAPLAAADLVRLGCPVPAALPGADPFGTAAAWWGWFYVADGASLGGALITRRLAEAAPDLPRLSLFDPYGADRARIWQAVCARLDEALADPAVAAEALRGARFAFGLFRRMLGAAAMETTP